MIGTVQRVMIDGCDVDTERFFGRTQAHAPEVDGVVYLENGFTNGVREEMRPGDMVDVRINQALDYDLIGAILNA